MNIPRLRWYYSWGMAACLAALLIAGIPAQACDIAVVSAGASTTGRPFIWKNFDASDAYQQQVKYFEATGNGGPYLLLYHYDDVTAFLNGGDNRCPQGGSNSKGFAMVVTSVYEDMVTPLNEGRNMNVTFLRQAVAGCANIAEFEAFLKAWPGANVGRTLSGNFGVIDANGGAALYEIYTGSAVVTNTTTPVLQIRKCDANTGIVTDENGNRAATALSAAQSTAFPGWFGRTNSHTWLPSNPGGERQAMLTARLTELTEAKTLNPRTCMLKVSKDITQGKVASASASTDTKWSTTFCVSRSATRSGMCVDGVANGGNAKLTTLWVCLGEPSIGVFVPYFPNAGAVSPYAYMDTLYADGSMADLNDTSLLAMAEDSRETSGKLIYNSNRGNILYGPYDATINKTELNKALTWIRPIEETIYEKAAAALSTMRTTSSLATADNLLALSNFCAEYAYKNYSNASDAYMAWTYVAPTSSTTPPEPPATVPTLSASLSVQSWGLGYVAYVTVKNTGTGPSSAWQVNINLNGSYLINVWNATQTQSGTTATFKSTTYNGTIPAGESKTFGFQALTPTFGTKPTLGSVSYN